MKKLFFLFLIICAGAFIAGAINGLGFGSIWDLIGSAWDFVWSVPERIYEFASELFR